MKVGIVDKEDLEVEARSIHRVGGLLRASFLVGGEGEGGAVAAWGECVHHGGGVVEEGCC